MSMLKDPNMQEIVDEFVKESSTLFAELEKILENLEENPSQQAELEKFGQVIDRVMGAAKSIGINEIATLCEMGKIIGYKSSQTNDEELLTIVVATMADMMEMLKIMLNDVKERKDKIGGEINLSTFSTRLKWLADKFKNIERASVGFKKQ